MKDASCAGKAPNKRENPNARDIFFPDFKKGETFNEAVMICMSCPVIQQCQELMDNVNARHGMWGALKGKDSR